MTRFPHPLALLTFGIMLAAALTYVVPAGEFERRDDPNTGRSVVVSGTYHRVPQTAVPPVAIPLSVPRGIADAAAVIAVVFLAGAAFTVVDRTGALRKTLTALVDRLGRHASIAIPICCVAFAAAGALFNMQEEIVALVPVLLLLSVRLGADGITAAAMSIGAAAVGSAFSPVNPFQVVIAQQISDVPLFSASGFRMVVFVPALAIWTWGTMRHARRVAKTPARESRVHLSSGPAREALTPIADSDPVRTGLTPARTTIIMLLVAGAFAMFIVGLARYEWGFDELSAIFLTMGIVCGLVGGLGVNGTASGFVDGFKAMAFSALLIGFARAIFVVLNDGHIVDTLVHAMAAPLERVPAAIAPLGMLALHTVTHVAVPSVSGQAVLTMPILAPLSDLLGVSRQTAILAYQYGAGLCELLTPTNGALMAVIAAAGVRYEQWMSFVFVQWALLIALSASAILIALAIGVH